MGARAGLAEQGALGRAVARRTALLRRHWGGRRVSWNVTVGTTRINACHVIHHACRPLFLEQSVILYRAVGTSK